MRIWRRPYPLGVGRWVVAAWEAAALLFLYRATVDLFQPSPRAGTVLATTLAVAWIALCIRLTRIGVYVGPGGIQIRGLFTGRTIPWPVIGRIVVEDANHRLLGVSVPAGRTAIIELADGTRINSTLWAKGIDFTFAPARFRQACAALVHEHRAMTRADLPSFA